MSHAVFETLRVAGEPMTLRDLTPQDAPALLALHHEVFGSQVDAAWFDWKYRQGGGEGVGLWWQGTLIAHCGGVPRRFSHAGRRTRDLQIGDVMVSPPWRGVLTRTGPFHHVSRGFYRSRLGSGRFHAGYGFPGDRHLQLAVRTGLLRAGGVVSGLRWDGPAALPWSWRARVLAPTEPGFDAMADRAWARMLAAGGRLSLGWRDAAWLRWRYLRRPGHSAVFLALYRPWRREPEGLAVLAPQPGDASTLQWLDWVGPPERMALACAACRTETARRGVAHLTAWASPAVTARLAATEPQGCSEVARIGMPRAALLSDAEVVALDWWFMGGDTDFL